MISKDNENTNKIKKITFIFILILLCLVILLFSVFDTINSYRRLPTLNSKIEETAIRGDIISADNFKITRSTKIYKAVIDTRHLNIHTKDLFIKLFSIYSNMSIKKLRKKINKSLLKPGNLVLTYNIDSKTAKNLKELSFKLRRLGVFKYRKVKGGKILLSLNIIETGERRLHSYGDSLSPVIGRTEKVKTSGHKIKLHGRKGLERKYNVLLNNKKDGVLSGSRDILSYISFDRKSTIKKRVDGANLILNIPLTLQKDIEMILDIYKKKLSADEIIVAVMESSSGKILSLASSNRFNPQRIKQKDISFFNVNAIEYQFEPGSVIKPITMALLLDKNKVRKNELIFAHNRLQQRNGKNNFKKGRIKIGKYYIKDDHVFKKHYLSLDDIIIHSSNIGILKLAQRLKATEMHAGFKKFGFEQKTGIDLPYERKGKLPKIWQLAVGEKKKRDNVYKATMSYGQGMTSTFIQLLKAYSVFDNNGLAIKPKILSYFSIDDNKYKIEQDSPKRIVSKKTANEIKRMLIKTVNKGTGRTAHIDGLIIGGKTGTAQIAGRGAYLKKYISSFFGFVNDKHNKYTIGVTVINPISTGKYWYYHYAASSAAPVFKEIVQTLVKLNYLKPKQDIIKK